MIRKDTGGGGQEGIFISILDSTVHPRISGSNKTRGLSFFHSLLLFLLVMLLLLLLPCLQLVGTTESYVGSASAGSENKRTEF